MNLPFLGKLSFVPNKQGHGSLEIEGGQHCSILWENHLAYCYCILTVYNWIYTLLFYNRTNSSYVTNVKSYLYIPILHTLNQ